MFSLDTWVTWISLNKHNFFTNQVYVKSFTVVNGVSNSKLMIIIQNAFSLTEID